MWVDRELLEDELRTALKGGQYIVVHGESGSGKTWLCKKVLKDLGAVCWFANFAKVAQFESIAGVLKNLIDRRGESQKVGYSETKESKVSLALAKGGLAHEGVYQIGQMEPYEACLRAIRKEAGKRQGVLIFDNLEAILDQPEKALKELSNLILLCDDEVYASYGVKIIILGTNLGLKRYYRKSKNHASISNRLREIAEVSRLKPNSARRLLKKGFIDCLDYTVVSDEGEVDDDGSVFDEIVDHILWVTDCIPQDLHAYGFEVARLAEESDGMISPKMLWDADLGWMQSWLTEARSVIEDHADPVGFKNGRRNQVLFSLSRLEVDEFSSSDVEARMRSSFPVSTGRVKSSFSKAIKRCSEGERPILALDVKRNKFRFVSCRYRMALRVLLRISADEVVSLNHEI